MNRDFIIPGGMKTFNSEKLTVGSPWAAPISGTVYLFALGTEGYIDPITITSTPAGETLQEYDYTNGSSYLAKAVLLAIKVKKGESITVSMTNVTRASTVFVLY